MLWVEVGRTGPVNKQELITLIGYCLLIGLGLHLTLEKIARAPVENMENLPIQVSVRRLTRIRRAQVRNRQLNYDSGISIITDGIVVEHLHSLAVADLDGGEIGRGVNSEKFFFFFFLTMDSIFTLLLVIDPTFKCPYSLVG